MQNLEINKMFLKEHGLKHFKTFILFIIINFYLYSQPYSFSNFNLLGELVFLHFIL